MTDYQLSAKVRNIFGRKVKSLRRAGLVPANVFGKKSKSVALELDHKALIKVVSDAGETGLIKLSVDGESKARPVLVAGYAQDPVSGALLHVDFHEVDLTVKTTAAVPVETVGEAPAVKAGGLLVVLKNEIEVEALPADFPDSIQVDVTTLEAIGASILVKDLKLDRTKVTPLVEDEEVVVTIQEPQKEEEPAPAAEAEAGEAAPAEGEAKPEAEAAPADAPKE